MNRNGLRLYGIEWQTQKKTLLLLNQTIIDMIYENLTIIMHIMHLFVCAAN